LPDPVIADFSLFGIIQNEVRIMQASSEEEIMEAVTDILRRTPHPELKSAFDHWVNQYDWIVIHNGEYCHDRLKHTSFSLPKTYSWMMIYKAS
jgi:hypothetical protein